MEMRGKSEQVSSKDEFEAEGREIVAVVRGRAVRKGVP